MHLATAYHREDPEMAYRVGQSGTSSVSIYSLCTVWHKILHPNSWRQQHFSRRSSFGGHGVHLTYPTSTVLTDNAWDWSDSEYRRLNADRRQHGPCHADVNVATTPSTSDALAERRRRNVALAGVCRAHITHKTTRVDTWSPCRRRQRPEVVGWYLYTAVSDVALTCV